MALRAPSVLIIQLRDCKAGWGLSDFFVCFGGVGGEVLEIKPRASGTLGKCSSAELKAKPAFWTL